MNVIFVVILSILIFVVTLIIAFISIRNSRTLGRGSLPGKGVHVIDAHYSSGAGGGGHSSTYTVPKDPQEYAKCFVPRGKQND
ncbi:MAG: hypothetical protein OXC62_02800 [Aestuariivita sp.]|nr:hypothetical protein [Aestuariivita sp.]